MKGRRDKTVFVQTSPTIVNKALQSRSVTVGSLAWVFMATIMAGMPPAAGLPTLFAACAVMLG